MAKAVKLADIAERLGVSTVTVSKALSGQKGVSEELRAKIKSLADEMGYRQPSTQRREKAGRSYNIGVLISERYLDKYDSFYWQMYQQVATRAVAKESFTLMEVVSTQAEAECEMPKLVQEQKVDGIIIIGRLFEHYLSFLNEKTGLPLIYLDFCDEKADTDAVISDSYYGAYRLTNYLFDMGHRRIAYVGTLLATGSITDRYFGYVKSLLEHGLAVREDWVIEDRDKETGEIDVERLIQLPEEMPTAFVCNCDLTASYLIKKLRDAGYRVPEDISVAGYDNYLFPGLCDVAITTYEVDMKEMARRAIQTLTKKINGESYRQGICIVEGHMVIKDSVRRVTQ
ncbi:MAG: substrate-binding domain-containing protein [Roseburia sp.]|nr:substrate-binding domain-containing protein [Roseburia sp.]